MEGNFEPPISTLKVDFGCSRDCPMDVKNMLQQLKGVKSISIDPDEGKVTVVGNVDPMMLIKLFKKMGKKAQLWSFDKAPIQSKTGSQYPKKKHGSHCCCESSDSKDDSDHDSNIQKARSGQGRHGPKGGFGFGNKHVPSPPVAGYHCPQRYFPFSGYHSYPPVPWFQPVAIARPVPPCGYYGRGHPVSPIYGHFSSRLPKYNPMIHYTSYADNYRYDV